MMWLKNLRWLAMGALVFSVTAFVTLPVAEAGMIRVVPRKSDAKVVVFVTDRRTDADLGVFVTRYTIDAQGRDAFWKFVDRQIDANTTVYFTNYRNDADVVIFYVTHTIDAKWYRSNPFQGKFR